MANSKQSFGMASPAFDTWKRPKIPITPEVTYHQVDQGCPLTAACARIIGSAPAPLFWKSPPAAISIAPSAMPIPAGNPNPTRPWTIIDRWYESAARAGSGSNIQLSGGEPTVRDDLPDIVSLGRQHGFGFIQINTNGLRLADDPSYAKALKNADWIRFFCSSTAPPMISTAKSAAGICWIKKWPLLKSAGKTISA
jgi:hypothetical protein